MKNTHKKDVPETSPVRNRWFAGYIVAGLIWNQAHFFEKTSIDGLIILVIAISSGVLYHRVKLKLQIKNEVARIVITFLILSSVSVLLIVFLTTITDNYL